MVLITPKDVPNDLRDNPSYFDPNGIGGYKITSADGKTYHYSLPVYHYERISRTQLENQEYQSDIYHPILNQLIAKKYDCKNVNETRQFTRYATHWLLTAVTGPDYVDRQDPNNSNVSGTFNKEDYGYWVELEYGKWSDGYVWRAPYQDFVYDYSTNINGKIEDDDKGFYTFGRKQVYYLDRVNTKNRSALFIKDIRYDGIGKDLTFKFLNKNKGGSSTLGNSGNGTNENSLNFTNPNLNVREDNVNYTTEYTLMLDKIVLIDSEKSNLINEAGNSNLGSVFPNYVPNSSHNPGWSSPYFISHYGSDYEYDIHQEQNVLDIGDISSTFINDNAIKVIQFNHDYQLVRDTPSSRIVNSTYGGNDNAARLTLNSVETRGRGNTGFMPPTAFEYYDSPNISNPNFLPSLDDSQASIQALVEQRRDFVDSWGYMQNTYPVDGETHSRAELWSLKQIQTPTGATVKINYEEDDYWTEAFSRRYWTKDLAISLNPVSGGYEMQIQNHYNIDSDYLIDDFNDYFVVGKKVYLDLWLCYKEDDGGGNDRGWFNIRPDDTVTVQSIEVNNNGQQIVTFKILDTGAQSIYGCPNGDYDCGEGCQGAADYGDCKHHLPYLDWMDNTSGYRKSSGHYPANYPSNNSLNQSSHRGACIGNNGDDAFNLVYKLLANRVPENETGGGLRVKEIVTNEANNIYKAKFDYSHPTEGRSSGITSYAPVGGLKFVPYQSEIPPPGVMYEYVTMSETDALGNYNAKTRYRHHVLKPVFNIFNPEIEMEALDSDAPFEDKLFWANITEDAGGLDGNNAKNVEAKKIELSINTALFGQVKSIELLNSLGHVMNKVEHQYSNGQYLDNSDSKKGYVKETFNSLKTVFVSNTDGTQVTDNKTKRLLSISSKTEYKNVLKKTLNTSRNINSYVEYSELDPWLNSFRTTKTKMSNGSFIKTDKIPAYTKYPEMGSKVDDVNNKNMLAQEAMTISSWSASGNNNTWANLNATITSWNDEWSYRDKLGNESNPINETPVWRKHKSFVWKDDVNPVHGTYMTSVNSTNDHFDWEDGSPDNGSKWQKTSEITRYTHWSSPIETKDINGNFASSKMADDFTKIIVGGNARHTEMYYSGAEHVASGNVFEGEVLGANYRTDEVAHTGEYAVKTNSANNKVFQVLGEVSTSHEDLSKEFRPGKYKVSFWTHQQYGTDTGVKLKFNNSDILESETVSAGCWKQFNYYVDLQPNTNFDLYITNSNGGGYYFDDFRMHPVYASINSYVYDQDTDELLYILGANNMATSFRYDNAGRLKTSYKEVENADGLDGGFKIISQYKSHYKETNTSTNYNEDINNCITYTFDPLYIKGLDISCLPEFNAYDIKYKAQVSGGSGNFKYEWQWLVNGATGQFSNWIVGSQNQYVPYAAKYCSAESFDKKWSVKVKVTDLTTGETLIKSNEYDVTGCLGYINNAKVLLGVEASQCHNSCGKSKYQYHIFPLDGSLPLPQSTAYTDNNSGISTSFDFGNGEVLICPEIMYVETGQCETGFIKFVSITPTYQGSTGFTYEFYLDCVTGLELETNPQLIGGVANDPIYAKPGILIKKDGKGKIISVTDINEKKS